MILHATHLDGAFWIEPEVIEDDRGAFSRAFCADAFAKRGLETHFVQNNVSNNRRRGTLRGLHFQRAPHWETKLVRCTRGRVFDVIVDLRPDSATRGDWFGLELSEENGYQMYVPRGFAHGFQTLEDHSSLYYLMSEVYVAELAAGIRHDDPAIGVDWPLSSPILSDRDQQLPILEQL